MPTPLIHSAWPRAERLRQEQPARPTAGAPGPSPTEPGLRSTRSTAAQHLAGAPGATSSLEALPAGQSSPQPWRAPSSQASLTAAKVQRTSTEGWAWVLCCQAGQAIRASAVSAPGCPQPSHEPPAGLTSPWEPASSPTLLSKWLSQTMHPNSLTVATPAQWGHGGTESLHHCTSPLG